jgi:HicA toxin of bacterial toxin-antitoxin,
VMATIQKILDQVISGRGQLRFRDLQRLVPKLGFHLVRVRGSHHIYVHPKVPRPLNLQPVGKDAKYYQVAQLRGMIGEFGLSLEG